MMGQLHQTIGGGKAIKILVTGSNGFLGRAFVEKMSIKHEIIEISSSKKNSNNCYKCDGSTYRNLSKIIPDRDIDVCIHFSWKGSTGIDKTNTFVQKSNVDYTLDLIDSLSELGVKRFIGIGTLAEKEVVKYHLSNTSKPNPATTYGVCKLMAHMLSRIACVSKGITYTWCTIANVYGPADHTQNFITKTIDNLSSTEDSIFTSGTQLYDFIYISDVVAALKTIMETPSEDDEFYIGSGNPLQLRDYVTIIAKQLNSKKELIFGGRPYNNAYLDMHDFDISRVRSLGFMPLVAFEEGIKTCLTKLPKDINESN